MKTKEQKRLEAEERRERCSMLTPLERIHMLDQRLGKGVGAVRERERLEKMLARER